MPDTVIKVENLGKKYIIGHQSKGSYKTYREQIGHSLNNILSKTRQILSGQQLVEGDEMEEFWALKDINFEVKQGQTLGIIGKNGAGKSTLLKILSRITEPTTGRLTLRGRVASLLEVGTGFHPELSGRENIFLNGAILGMNRSEIKRKFDAIVDFSGVEKFLDTPVKRYSSGMYVRLAFSIAAHLEPEILVVDEVLAVGDAEFQKKCLGKMNDVSKNEGRTVLFVSHNMQAVETLCNRGMVLRNGNLVFDGSVEKSISEYIRESEGNSEKDYTGDGIIRKVSIISNRSEIIYKSEFVLKVEFSTETPINNLVLGIVIKDIFNTPLVGINNRHYYNRKINEQPVKSGAVTIKFNELELLPGIYNVDVFLGDSLTDVQVVENALSFVVNESPVVSTANQLDYKLNKIYIRDVSWELAI